MDYPESKIDRVIAWAMLFIVWLMVLLIAANYNWPVRDWLRAMGGVL